MAVVSIQLDDSLVEDARTLLQAWQEAGYASKTMPLSEEHVLHTAINLGLGTLRGVWLREGATNVARLWREEDAAKKNPLGIYAREPGSEAREGAVEAARPQDERDGV
jgi:hypothetical protein